MKTVLNYYSKLINNNYFIYLLSIFIFILTYKYNLFKFVSVNGPLMPRDGDRYLRPNNFKEMLSEQYFCTFCILLFFVGIFKKYNLINLIPIIQFLIFHHMYLIIQNIVKNL